MENREAIEWLKGCVVAYEVDNKGKPNGNVTCELIQEVIDTAISALEKQEQDRWIPVTERLPGEDDYRPCYEYDDGAVWWLNDIGIMGLGWYYTSTEKWAFYDETTHTEGVVGNVTAWRPLPEAYREGEA